VPEELRQAVRKYEEELPLQTSNLFGPHPNGKPPAFLARGAFGDGRVWVPWHLRGFSHLAYPSLVATPRVIGIVQDDGNPDVLPRPIKLVEILR
jgi:hypothetical protein